MESLSCFLLQIVLIMIYIGIQAIWLSLIGNHSGCPMLARDPFVQNLVYILASLELEGGQ